jgi:hypothetical protein
MNTSSEFIAGLGTADEFVSHLRRLASKRLGELARRVEDTRATPDGDVDWWRATAACPSGFATCIAPVKH